MDSIPFVRTIYIRAIDTLGKNLQHNRKQFRPIVIEGYRFNFDVTDFAVSTWYFHQRLFEPETTRFILDNIRPNQTVIDIGANRGYITILSAIRVGATGKVYSFEPNPGVHRDLLRHVEMNQLSDRVSVSRLALSDADDQEATFYVSNLPSNSGLSSLTPQADLLTSNALSAGNTIRVKTTTLDVWLDHRGNEQPIDFIKVDVEGAEMMVLSGATETLRHSPPKQWIIETKLNSGVAELMHSYGYKTRCLEQYGDTINLLCIHSSLASASD